MGDLDSDGYNEYIISVYDHIYAYRYDGTIQSGFPIFAPASNLIFSNHSSAPSLGDLDLDGYPEIITSGGDRGQSMSFVAVYDHLGNRKPPWPRFWLNQQINNIPTPSDINRDGRPEIGIEYEDTMTFIDIDGRTLQGFPASPQGSKHCHSDFITVDLNGDGLSEIFTDDYRLAPDSIEHDTIYFFGHGYLYGIDHNGHDLPEYPIVLRGSTDRHPPLFSLDLRNNRLYMAISYNMIPFIDIVRVDLFQFPDSTGPLTEWPMKNHDLLQTRNYNFIDRVTSINSGNKPILPKNCVLKQNYPNPFNGSTIIEFTLPKEEDVNLSIYDILGRKIKEISQGRFRAGTHRETINMNDAASGEYFCILQGEKTKISRKMILVK